MSQSDSEHDSSQDQGITDEQLPDDLVPDEEENPLAAGLEPGETVDDMLDGKGAEEPEDGGDGSFNPDEEQQED